MLWASSATRSGSSDESARGSAKARRPRPVAPAREAPHLREEALQLRELGGRGGHARVEAFVPLALEEDALLRLAAQHLFGVHGLAARVASRDRADSSRIATSGRFDGAGTGT
jgi:hypothetical protein